MDAYSHKVIDLSLNECMIGLKYGLLSMSIAQKCKIWIPKRLTKCLINNIISTQKCDILVECELLNIIRSDIYKNTTYTNDIILNATKQRHKRANTVSLTPPPIMNIIVDNIDDKNDENDIDLSDLNEQFAVPDLKSFGGHIEHQNSYHNDGPMNGMDLEQGQ